jgi:hypothetical protein
MNSIELNSTGIVEATAREVSTKREKILKKKLLALLRDDGQGHKHAKYAERLEDFIIKIVPYDEDPKMTAAISFEEATIYISDGFLKDPDTFYQLNVLMRHELAHYLMQHQIRMMHKIIEKYGEAGGTRISMSQSLHHLMNIIEDFEISNERYTTDDKIVVKNMKLNGREIGGLITETIRGGWEKLSVLDMFDKLEEEIQNLQASIVARWQVLDMDDIGTKGDYIHYNVKDTLYYVDVKAPTNFLGTLEKFVNNRALYHFFPFDQPTEHGIVPCIVKYSSLPEVYQGITKDIFEAITAGYKNSSGATVFYTKQQVRDLVEQIAKTSILQVHVLKDPAGAEILTLYTPEEKLIAADSLKALIPTLELRQTWYNKVTNVMGDESKYSLDDLEAALAALEN